ncbi:tripartite tricarboxylate transporter TctB family protein [Cereibacter sphaeroides]|nr:tripartite tricarboxylate transporter TctB family protein [Cereibacter sphaeroides]
MTRDRILGLGLIVLGGIGIALSLGIHAMTFNNDPGPQLFPIFACTILGFCGLMMLLTGRTDRQTGPAFTAETARAGLMAALMVAYGVGLWLLGFAPATALMSFAVYWVIAGPKRRKAWIGALYALLVTGAIWLLFAKLLNAFLPQGILF